MEDGKGVLVDGMIKIAILHIQTGTQVACAPSFKCCMVKLPRVGRLSLVIVA